MGKIRRGLIAAASSVPSYRSGMYVAHGAKVTMGGKTWKCTAVPGTFNPPMGVITDKDGNRLMFTESGNANACYLLSGDVNADEYSES